MDDRRQYLNLLVKRLTFVFWTLLIFTVILAFREYQYVVASAPSSGNWAIDNSNNIPNNYIYDWISYINIVLIVIAGTLTFTVYFIKKLFEDLRKNNK